MGSNQSVSSFSNPVHPRVILVDDSSSVLQDLRLLLELPGDIEIIAEASNGQEAVRLADALAPDVVIMDLEMPILNGYAATCQIKSHLPATRVVILSVHAGLEEQEKAYAAGADYFVVKGSGYEALLNAILGKSAPPDSPKRSRKKVTGFE